MKKLAGIALISSFFIITGCGGGGSDSGSTPPLTGTNTSTGSSPVVSALAYSPTSGIYSTNHTSETVTGSVKVDDVDGDIASVVISSTGQTPITIPVNVGTATSTTVTITLNVSLYNTSGVYNFDVYAVDSKGNKSNQLSGTFKVGKSATETTTYSINAQGVLTINPFTTIDSFWKMLPGQYTFVSVVSVDPTYTCVATSITVRTPDNSIQTWSKYTSSPQLCGGGPATSASLKGNWAFTDATGSQYLLSYDAATQLTVSSTLYP